VASRSDDVYTGRTAGHPSDNIAACLAVAEAERASAAELITAIVLAYEINCRRSPRRKGRFCCCL
jgi:2-methylcitrate dehydratase